MSGLTKADLQRIESTLSVSLPDSYRDFAVTLRTDDVGPRGMEFLTRADWLFETNHQLDIADWLSGSEWEESSPEWDFEEIDYFFAFAGDGCGNYYLIDPDEEDSPIYFLSHDPVSFEDIGMSFSELREETANIRKNRF